MKSGTIFYQDYCPRKHNNWIVTNSTTEADGSVLQTVVCQTCQFTWTREVLIPATF